MTRWALTMFLAVTVWGCGMNASVEKRDVEQVKESAGLIGAAGHALRVLGILPSYECGESRRHFAGRLTSGHELSEGCVTAATVQEGELGDALTIDFAEGCHVGDKQVRGTARGLMSGGEDRFTLSLDLQGVTVDGDALPASAGYEVCGDEDRYSAFVQAQLSQEPLRTFELQAQLARRDGIFLIGQDTLVLDGEGHVSHPAGQDLVAFDHLTYEMKQLMPWDGSLEVSTSDGRKVRAEFDSENMPYRTGHLSVQVDEGKTVRVPVIR